MFAGGDMDWDLGQRYRGVDFLGENFNKENGSVIDGLPAPFKFPYELGIIDPRTTSGVVTINRTLYTASLMDVSFSGSPSRAPRPMAYTRNYSNGIPGPHTSGETESALSESISRTWTETPG
ncbi:hypothetical protein PM082_004696 [Marasmius tenuissimus]|nr:hypothetical protein PM082_004696 [Marasmius tenuissimus]